MLIGLTGRIGAGKDTVAARLAFLLEPDVSVEQRSFAGPLKDSVCALFGITRAQLEVAKRDDDSGVVFNIGEEFDGMSFRSLLQRYGTEAHRDVFGTDFWLDQTLPADDISAIPSTLLVVITDCRFENEAQRVKDCGGKVFEVVGPEGRMDPDAPHASERALPPEMLDGYIYNQERDDFVTLDCVLTNMLRAGEVTA